MRPARVLSLLALVAAPVACQPAAAAEPPRSRWEVGVFAGGYFGTGIYTSPTLDIKIDSAVTVGARVGYHLTRRVMLELSWARAGAHLESKDPPTGNSVAPDAPIDVVTYELGGLFEFGRGDLRGTIGCGMGAMSLYPYVSGVAVENRTGFAGYLALGARLPLDRHWVLRADGRYRWAEAPSRTGSIVCGAEGCFAFTTNLYSSSELTAGVSYRF